MSPPRLYTIGHSNHSGERFLELLQQHGIEVLVDVRSTPFSRFNPQFNRERLENSLNTHGIRYLFLGAGLGARSKDPGHYDAGRVNYRKLAASEPFQRDLAQLLTEAKAHRTAIMCAEREPLDCHRTILVAREVERSGMSIEHILADGTLEPNAHALQRLIAKLDLPQQDLFGSTHDLTDAAYDKRATQVAYVQKNPSVRR